MEKFFQNKIWYGAMLAVMAAIVWSGNFVIARGVIKSISPVTLSFYRWLTATILIAPFAWKHFRAEWKTALANPYYFLFTAIISISLYNTLIYIAGHYTGAINLALIGTTTSPVVSVILARIMLKEKITTLRVIGMGICIAGILLLLSKGSLAVLLSFSFTKGDWWMLAAAFVFAVYNIAAKKKPSGISPLNFLFTLFLLGTLFLIPFYLYDLRTNGGIAINASNISAILYLGAGASVISYLLWNIAIAQLGAGRTSLFGNLIPVFSSIEAVIFLHEKISWVHMASFAIVVTGLIIANIQKRA